MDNRAVTRAIGRIVWPQLRAVGFESFTGRNAWRYVGAEVDVVNFRSYGGTLADSAGCTLYVWFVLPDGSNLTECVEDALLALTREGLPSFESLRS